MKSRGGLGVAVWSWMLVLLVGVPGYGRDVPGTPSTEEAALKEKLRELNRVTGNEPLQAALKRLLADETATKKLIGAAAPWARDKKDVFTYNGALLLALASADLKDLGSAEAFFRVCMEQAAKLQSARKLLQSYVGLIDLYFDAKRFEDSARICRELLELKTDDGKPRVVLQAYTTRFGDVDFIEDDSFDTAKRLRPGVHRMLIQAITKQGKYDQALKLSDSLIKATDHWLERQLKGWVLREAGKFQEAVEIYEDVIDRVGKDKDLDGEERDAYQERYKYVLSNIYMDLKRIDKAADLLQELLKKKPDDPGYLNDLGYIWADHDMNLAEAEKMIRRAIELDRKRRKVEEKGAEFQDNGAYLDSLGWVLFKQKRYKEAKEVLLQAIKDKNSQHIEIYDHLGDVHMILGEKEAALAAWRKGLEVVGEGRREMEHKARVEKKLEKHK